jgi:BirA family biotin operon repressor/biotin-[acetyl-CoA-carboxylase] ligase
MTTLHGALEAIWLDVAPFLPGFTVEQIRKIDSTNSELVRRARDGRLEPVLLVAECQTAGRGRLGRDWHSDTTPAGASLTFSLGLPYEPHDWSGLSLAVGLNIVHSLHPALQLKWPNDIWWQGRKIGGILIETVVTGSQRYAVIGVGLNIRYQPTQDGVPPSATLQNLMPDITAAQALLQIVPPIVQHLQQFSSHGFAPLQLAFGQRDALFGHNVVCTNHTTGVARGVDAKGALLVHTTEGIVTIHSSEVSVKPS